jgi:hypothetical protein
MIHSLSKTPNSLLAVLCTGVIATACASGGPGPDATAAPAVVAPLPGDNYALVYAAGDRIGLHDTRTGNDRDAVMGVAEVLAVAVSRGGGRVAIAYAGGDGNRVAAVDAATGAVTEIPQAAGGEEYTLAWSMDGTHLGVGVRGATSGVFWLGPDGAVHSMGCSASDGIEAWRSPTQAVVQDERNFYTVRASDCGTLARFTKVGHPGATFADNGRRVAYYQNRQVRQQGGGTVAVPELWIAGHDGNGATKIADFQSRPANHAWSPDGAKLAYEVESRRWANTSHLVVYDVATAEFAFIAEEKSLGVPSDFGACWSGDGRRLAHERLYSRSTGTRQYSTRQVVVRDGETEHVIFDELVNLPPATIRAQGGPGCRWLGDRYVLVPSRTGYRVIDADDGEAYTAASDWHVLGATVFRQED